MNILFAGTPRIAVPCLKALAREFTVSSVLCAPDAFSGRGRKCKPCAVKVAALELGLPVICPGKLGSKVREQITQLQPQPQLLAVFAFGHIFGPKFLELFPLGGINVHPSLLPRYRGPAPIPAAIMNGDRETGITVQKISLEMDAGDILQSNVLALDGRETTESLSRKVSELAPDILLKSIREMASGDFLLQAQDDAAATYTSIIRSKDARILWERGAVEIERAIRAYWPKAYTFLDGMRISIHDAEIRNDSPGCVSPLPPGGILPHNKELIVQTGQGILGIKCLQPAAGRPMDAASFLNGFRIETDSVLG